jgi:hypothetical protein
MSPNMSPNKKGELPKFLSGWKDISTYLGKGVRTVQRYEREMGLPVRRPAGKSRAAVIATKAELDAWVDASPFRDAFSLQHRNNNVQELFTSNINRSLQEMQRLRDQMTELRGEVSKSVALLRETVHVVHTGSNARLSGSSSPPLSDLDAKDDALFALMGMRGSGRVS